MIGSGSFILISGGTNQVTKKQVAKVEIHTVYNDINTDKHATSGIEIFVDAKDMINALKQLQAEFIQARRLQVKIKQENNLRLFSLADNKNFLDLRWEYNPFWPGNFRVKFFIYIDRIISGKYAWDSIECDLDALEKELFSNSIKGDSTLQLPA